MVNSCMGIPGCSEKLRWKVEHCSTRKIRLASRIIAGHRRVYGRRNVICELAPVFVSAGEKTDRSEILRQQIHTSTDSF